MAKRFKLEQWVPRETDIKWTIFKALEYQVKLNKLLSVQMHNGGGVYSEYQGRKSWIWFYQYNLGAGRLRKGFPDINGFCLDGTGYFLEVKRPGEKATAEQIEFLRHHAGVCKVGIVTNVDEAFRVVRGEISNWVL